MASGHPFRCNGQQMGSTERKLAEIFYAGCTYEICRSHSTYLPTDVSKFCEEKIAFRALLAVFPPSIGFRHEAGRNSVNGFQGFEFALAHMFSSDT